MRHARHVGLQGCICKTLVNAGAPGTFGPAAGVRLERGRLYEMRVDAPVVLLLPNEEPTIVRSLVVTPAESFRFVCDVESVSVAAFGTVAGFAHAWFLEEVAL